MPRRLARALWALRDFAFEYFMFLKFEVSGSAIRIADFAVPLQRVSKTSFLVLDYSPVARGFEGTLHKHPSCGDFSPRDRALVKAYPLNLLVVGDRIVKVYYRGSKYGVMY
ncbi:MAG: hypothetical protein GXO07_01085 [Crenarchaeota archaeon]|nr:hypothetical protein [Thermoproteota archaeon]